MLVVIPEMKTESLSSWMSYETKSALRHHRISQHLQVSYRLVSSLNLKILMNLTLKCVLLRVIPRACWEHTLLPGALGVLLCPWGSAPCWDDAPGQSQSVAQLRGAGLPAHCSSGVCSVQSCPAEPHTTLSETLPCPCAWASQKRPCRVGNGAHALARRLNLNIRDYTEMELSLF